MGGGARCLDDIGCHCFTWEMNLSEKTKLIQAWAGLPPADQDGKYGNQTADAIIAKAGIEVPKAHPVGQNEWHRVKASSFADPADIRAFKRCKSQGKSDQECFKVGDNGIGKWGDDTTVNKPMCALPPDDWENLPKPRGAKVEVNYGSTTIVCELRDTMPRKKNIKNGAGIDLNPAACSSLGLTPPIMISAAWRWA